MSGLRPGPRVLLCLALAIPVVPSFSSPPLAPVTSDGWPIGDSALRGRTLRVGGDWGYPPFEYHDETGRPAGFNVDIVRELGRILGVEMRVSLSRWSEARARLERGEVDFLAGMYRSEEREAEVDFTVPYFINTYRIFALGPTAVKGLEDLEGRSLAAQDGDLGHEYLLERGLGASLVIVPDWKDLFSLLADGSVDLVVSSEVQASIALESRKYPPITAVGEPLFFAEYCMAVRDGDADLLAYLNEGLSAMRASGAYDAIYERWFGGEPLVGAQARSATVIALSALSLTLLVVALAWIASLRRALAKASSSLAFEAKRGAEGQASLHEALSALEGARLEVERVAEEKAAFVERIVEELRSTLARVAGEPTVALGALAGVDTLLSDLLAATKSEGASLSLRHEAFSFPDLCASIEASQRPLAEERGLAFRFSAVGSGTVVGDRDRVSKVVTNLCANAIRFTVRGEVELAMELGDEGLYLSVSDTGPGIPDEAKARLFKPVFKEKPSPSGQGGLGLGLAVVKSIVDAMGGSIRYETHPSIGTRFEVSLPLERQDLGRGAQAGSDQGPVRAESPAPEALSSPAAPLTSMATQAPPPYGAELGRAIVAEDEAINRLYLKRLLETAGYEVIQAVDGEAALEAASEGTWSFILMDVSMPRMNGLESTRRIRELESSRGSPRVPIVALTAHAYAEDKQACAQAGMDGFLSKPFTESALWGELRRVLRKDAGEKRIIESRI